MTRRLLAAAAAATTIAAGGAFAVAGALAVTPPHGTPDLAKMTLQLTDLAPGAKDVGAYITPQAHVTAEYDRNFVEATTAGGVKLEGIDTEILLASTTAYAKTVFTGLRDVYGGAAGRAQLAAQIVKSAGKSAKLTAKDVHFGKLRSIGVGQQSLIVPISVATKTAALVTDVVALRVDGVVANLTFIKGGTSLAASVPTALSNTIAGHIRTVLASTGASG